MGREPSTSRTILDTLSARIRREGRTGGFRSKRRNATFGLTDGNNLNTQIVLVDPVAEVDVVKLELVFVSSEFSCRISILNLHLAEN